MERDLFILKLGELVAYNKLGKKVRLVCHKERISECIYYNNDNEQFGLMYSKYLLPEINLSLERIIYLSNYEKYKTCLIEEYKL